MSYTPSRDEIMREALEGWQQAVRRIAEQHEQFKTLGEAILRDANEVGYRGHAFGALAEIVGVEDEPVPVPQSLRA